MAMASASMRRLQSPLVEPRPTPPPSESIAAAIRRLRAIGAIEDDGPWLRDLPISLEESLWFALRKRKRTGRTSKTW